MTTVTPLVDPAALGRAEPIGAETTEALLALIHRAGVAGATLQHRYSVIFAFPGMGVGKRYPDLAGCTMEVCAFIDEVGVFAKHGIDVIGLSGEVSEPPEGCLDLPFPVGLIAQDDFAPDGPIRSLDQDGRRYAERTSFVTFPDGSGLRITGIADVSGHVRQCLELALAHRLERFRQATMHGAIGSLRSSAELRSLLPNGADSVAISRVDVTIPLVAKMASPAIVRQEAGYMSRINTMLEEAGKPRLFPAIVTMNDGEDPAWYLMEAADPVSLDRVLFADAERSAIDPARQGLLWSGIDRLSNLHELTLRRERSPVSVYHYRDRFSVIPARSDTRLTYELLVGNELDSLDELLDRPIVVDGMACHAYSDQLDFLAESIGELAQPVGAYLHGDAHLPNMLIADGGEQVVFVDPRVVWDGKEVGAPGFGDPLYDYATLLHSVHVMSAILQAVAEEHTDRLLSVSRPDGGPLELASGTMRIHRNPALGWFHAAMAHRLPREVAGANWEARIHVGTANALVGWLKYARSLQTGHAWMAVYASLLYHLEIGRRLLHHEEVDR